jgi:sulfate transport system permease protein
MKDQPSATAGTLSLRVVAIAFLLVMVALPLAAVLGAVLAGPGGLGAALRALGSRTARAALWLTVWTAAVVALVNAVMGTLTAWVLARYRFFGKAVLNAVIDLPFAIPTLVTGLMLVVLYGPQELLGRVLAAHGLHLLFAPAGIILSLLFVTFPFVVRAVEPVLMEVDFDQEEAATTLGASPFRTFVAVVLPALRPAVLTASLLTFTRALGEFGSVVVVAGNIPRRTLTAPVYVFGAIESGEPAAASAMSLLLVAVSAALIIMADRYTRVRARAIGVRV